MVMDMDHELHVLRAQLAEKSRSSLKLQKELALSKKGEKNTPKFFELDGTKALGSYLEIHLCSNKAPELLECSIQWYHLISDDGEKHLISGCMVKMMLTDYTFENWRRDPPTSTFQNRLSIDACEDRPPERLSTKIHSIWLMITQDYVFRRPGPKPSTTTVDDKN